MAGMSERFKYETKIESVRVSISDIGFLIREARRVKGTFTMEFREMSIQDFGNNGRVPLKLTLRIDFSNGRHHVDVFYTLGKPMRHCPSISFLERGGRRESSKVVLEKQGFNTAENDRRTITLDALLTKFKTSELLLNLELYLERTTPLEQEVQRANQIFAENMDQKLTGMLVEKAEKMQG